jgi:hypothetical protein
LLKKNEKLNITKEVWIPASVYRGPLNLPKFNLGEVIVHNKFKVRVEIIIEWQAKHRYTSYFTIK